MLDLVLTALPAENQVVFLKSSLIILYLILAALALSCIVFTFIMLRSQIEGTATKILLVALYLVTSFVLICAVLCTRKYKHQHILQPFRKQSLQLCQQKRPFLHLPLHLLPALIQPIGKSNGVSCKTALSCSPIIIRMKSSLEMAIRTLH